MIETALTKPATLGLPFACWTLDRLEAYLNEQKHIGMKRSRIDELLIQEGLRWRMQETWFSERVDPDFAEKKGAIVALYTAPPAGSVVICLDQLGPESAKTFKGTHIVSPPRDEEQRRRVPVETDEGRRGKGDIFGAFLPHDGAAFTAAYSGRTIVHWGDFLGKVEAWIAPEVERAIGIVDNLTVHRAKDVLLFCLAHPRWEFLFQPTYAPYLNLIEPWWKVLRSLALKVRRFESWAEIVAAVREATSYWNAHRHPFEWGKRNRKRPARRAGVAVVPVAA